jgi:hypothetical protein
VGVTWLGEDDVMGIDVGVLSMETVDKGSARTEQGDEMMKVMQRYLLRVVMDVLSSEACEEDYHTVNFVSLWFLIAIG